METNILYSIITLLAIANLIQGVNFQRLYKKYKINDEFLEILFNEIKNNVKH